MAYKINEDLYIGNTNKQLKDLPVPVHDAYSTSTTDSYSCNYLNDTIDNSRLKSAILVILNESTEVTLTGAWVQSRIPFNKVLRKLGDGFSLSNNGVVIPSNDIKRFRATVGVRLLENYSADVYPRILSEMGASWYSESGYQASSTQLKNETIGTCINNKNIYATITSSQVGTVKLRGDDQYTYMLVEEL